MSASRWLLLPFLGSSEGRERRHQESGRDQRVFEGDDGLARRETARDFAGKSETEIVEDYNAPTRWWVVSTLFPLIAGTFGPMANAFNIMAVSVHWRVVTDPSNTEAEGMYIPDPKWLIAVNAVSLGIAIISNIALLMHMTGRVRFNIAAPTVIIGWYVAGFLDIGLVAAAPSNVPLPANPLATYSQAYYYAIFSGAIYVLLSAMLSVTALGVWVGHFSKEFKLSLAQRGLMLQTILFLTYVLAAGAVYSRIEGWVYLDGVYFSVVTLFTIGFGDFTPKTRLGRGLFFPFAVGGIIFVGLIISNIRTLVLESVSVKVSTRMVEKARYKAIKSGDPTKGIVKIRGLRRMDTFAQTELERRRKEFDIMREIQKTAAHSNRMWGLSAALTAFVILWFVGGLCFYKAEQATGGQNWTYFESIYFTYVAQLTIGYGDFEPQTNASKPTFVFWSLIALPTLTVLIGSVGDAVTDFVDDSLLWLGQHAPQLAKPFSGSKMDASRDEVVKDMAQRRGLDDHSATDGFDHLTQVEDGHLVPASMLKNIFASLEPRDAHEIYRPFLVTKAAQIALRHMDEDSPRKYSYEEWAWLLKLLGEDEASEEGHRRVGLPVPEGYEAATPIRLHKHQVWSWMGQESPLMSLEDNSEPKWVLKRLLEMLERELRQRANRDVSGDAEKPVADPPSPHDEKKEE